MPSLEELRAWLRGDQVEGLPTRSEPLPIQPEAEVDAVIEEANRARSEATGGVDMDKMEESLKRRGPRGKARFEIIATREGKPDAILGFGKYRGSKVSELAKTEPSYLTWILGEGFDDGLKDIVRLYGVKEPKIMPRDKLMKVPIVRLKSLAREHGFNPEGLNKEVIADMLAMKMARADVEKYYEKFK